MPETIELDFRGKPGLVGDLLGTSGRGELSLLISEPEPGFADASGLS